MFDIRTLLILIPGLPLAATLLVAAFGRRVLGRWSHLPVIAALAASCAASVLLVAAVRRDMAAGKAEHEIGFERIVPLWTWAAVPDAYRPGESGRPAGNTPAASDRLAPASIAQSDHSPRTFHINITLRADPLTALMLVTVTFISLLVAVYSIGYMRGDPGYWRFFAYLGLFVFSMTMLVSASNFVLLYVFWEAVGMCSYLLIGFWFQKPEAAAAGMKAFLVNRVGDFGFALGVFLLWTTYGTLDFHDTAAGPGILGQTMLHQPSLYAHGGVATAICLLLLMGACGKSAQFPLHVWLPDAMEGPTPVSALIHAATMVTAGVYLVVRCTPLFAAAPDAVRVVAIMGGVTALLAALIALGQNDLKRILAYSTISQLGYMFLALGAGTLLGVSAAMFHLVTHAFFKALLFLGAGSVMHAMGGLIDIRRLGGLRRRMPVTHWTFLCGCLALAGVFPFAGFWSKDAILAALGQQQSLLYRVLYLVALGTVTLTAVYVFRAFFLTFYGSARGPEHGPETDHAPSPAAHVPHGEGGLAMTGPLLLLACGALAVGAYLQWTGDLLGPRGFLAQTPSLAAPDLAPSAASAEYAGAENVFDYRAALPGTLAALAGIALAGLLYLGSPRRAELLGRLTDAVGLGGLVRGKFFFDPLYRLLIVWPLEVLARLSAWADRRLIDGLVNLLGSLPARLGTLFRPAQGGLVQFYALAMALGLVILIAALLM